MVIPEKIIKALKTQFFKKLLFICILPYEYVLHIKMWLLMRPTIVSSTKTVPIVAFV
jgi:hypothetical protein